LRLVITWLSPNVVAILGNRKQRSLGKEDFMPLSPAKATPYPTLTTSEQLTAVRAFFGQIFRDELRQLLPQMAASTPVAATPQIGGLELAQEITGLSKPRLYTLVSERSIPHSKRGNKLYFNRAELIAWVGEGNRAQRPKNTSV
jgi:predicted DNA-binding transcriptional regulator AlpA